MLNWMHFWKCLHLLLSMWDSFEEKPENIGYKSGLPADDWWTIGGNLLGLELSWCRSEIPQQNLMMWCFQNLSARTEILTLEQHMLKRVFLIEGLKSITEIENKLCWTWNIFDCFPKAYLWQGKFVVWWHLKVCWSQLRSDWGARRRISQYSSSGYKSPLSRPVVSAAWLMSNTEVSR